MGVAALIKKSKASDLELEAETGIHSTLIWRYRTERVKPGPINGARLLPALRKRGVDAELADVLGVPRRNGRAA